MAAQVRELLGGCCNRERLGYEEVRDLGSKVVKEDERLVPQEEFRGMVFCFANRDDASGHVARNTEEIGRNAPPAYLQRA